MIRVLYAGSPKASVITLEKLLSVQSECGFEIVGVLSNPDTAKGRHKALTPTPVADFAGQNNIPVFKPEHLDGAARDLINPLKADILVSFAYGHIFGPKFLGLFPMGGINLHPSLLPKYRGCTPVPAAILNHDKETAVTIQTLALKMDEGNILEQEVISLNGNETAESLLNYAAEKGADLIAKLLNETSKSGKLKTGEVQKGEPSYTGIIKKEDGKINWSQSACDIEAKIRAYNPDPGCWCIEKGEQLRILEAQFISSDDDRASKYKDEPVGKVVDYIKADGIYIKTADGLLSVRNLQKQGKKAMNYKDFMNGARDFIGTILE